MATAKTSTATATSFSNTPQAVDDLFSTLQTGLTEDSANTDIVHLDVMLNDLGGAAKTLYSLDNATSDPTATKILAPVDLLTQDTARDGSSTDTSLNGAKIWITTDGKVAYEMTDASRTHWAGFWWYVTPSARSGRV